MVQRQNRPGDRRHRLHGQDPRRENAEGPSGPQVPLRHRPRQTGPHTRREDRRHPPASSELHDFPQVPSVQQQRKMAENNRVESEVAAFVGG